MSNVECVNGMCFCNLKVFVLITAWKILLEVSCTYLRTLEQIPCVRKRHCVFVCVCVVLLNWVTFCGYGPCHQTCLCESGYIINISAYRPQNVALQQLINPTCKCMYITFGYSIIWRVEARKGRVYLCVWLPYWQFICTCDQQHIYLYLYAYGIFRIKPQNLCTKDMTHHEEEL